MLAVGSVIGLCLPAAPAVAHHPTGALTPYEWACPAGAVPEDGFSDVPETNPHEGSVDCAVWLGLTRGTGARTYSPLTHVTRAQLASFVAPLLPDGDPETATAPGDAFDDDDGSVHEGAINRLASQGVVTGTGPRQYSPQALVTRAQMATYLVRAYELSWEWTLPQARDHFQDDDGSTHEQAINRAASLGLTSGVRDGVYEPSGAVRRDQMARFLTRTRGCSRFQPRDGQHHDPRCDRYVDTEGPQALGGFEVSVTTAREQVLGRPVAVEVRACNRRSTALPQTFPQKDWFVLEARHERLAASDDAFFPGRSSVPWYEHRIQGSVDGAGYTPYVNPSPYGERVLERNPDPVQRRVSQRWPHLQALTWFNGPQTGPAEVVVWQPGECKVLDVGAWGQGRAGYAEDMASSDFPGQWRHQPRNPAARVVPGWYILRLNWGGVEVGQTRRHLLVDSPRLHLDGPRVVASTDKPFYAPGEQVAVSVQACNDGDLPYQEEMGSQAFDVWAQGNLGGSARIGDVPAAERVLHWEPGECKSWAFTWDQRYDDGSTARSHESIRISGGWNTFSARPQEVQGADVGIS